MSRGALPARIPIFPNLALDGPIDSINGWLIENRKSKIENPRAATVMRGSRMSRLRFAYRNCGARPVVHHALFLEQGADPLHPAQFRGAVEENSIWVRLGLGDEVFLEAGFAPPRRKRRSPFAHGG